MTAETTSRRSQVAALLRAAARVDRSQTDPVVSARNAVGIAIPLVMATLVGSPAAGLYATIGAIQTAFADRPGPYRLRVLRMSGTAAAAACTSMLAVLTSQNDLGAVALLLVLAFGAGLMLAGGPAATQVGTAATAAALVLGHIPQAPGSAPKVGLLVLAGGAVQLVFAVAAWPLGRHRPERLALAGLYRALAGVARHPTGTATGPPATPVVDNVRQTLYGLGHDHGPSVEAYRVLLDEAERIRREVVVLSALGERLAAEDDPRAAEAVRAALAGAGDALEAVATALTEGSFVDRTALTAARGHLRQAIERVEQPGSARGEFTRRAAGARLRALAGQLRAVIDTAGTGAQEGRHPEAPDVGGGFSLRDPIAILRANLTPQSAVLRHAVRSALLVAGSDLVVREAGFYRGYWVALTILVVLRPDFATTLQRAVLRISGTLVGLYLATVLVHWIPGGAWYRILLIAVFAFGMRLFGAANWGLSAVALSGLVVVLLAINGVPPHSTLVNRSIATAVGGALALAAALLLPLWERQLLPVRLAALLAAYRTYLEAIADRDSTLAQRQRARAGARLARSNAQASVDRARAEPVVARAEVELGEAVLANSHRVVHALMTVDSVRVPLHRRGGLPALDALLRAAADALRACETAVRDGAVLRGVPALRPLQETLHRTLLDDPSRAGGIEVAGALADATDRLANGIDTLASEIRRQIGTGPAVTSHG